MIARMMLILSVILPIMLGAEPAHAEGNPDSGQLIEASLGARVSRVTNAGYDPFAESDDLPQLSLGLGVTAIQSGAWSLAGVGFWDYGARSSHARGAPTSLTVHRLSIGPELRYQLLRPLYVFVHVLPAFAHSRASIEDGVAQSTRLARHWSYGVDGALGASFNIYTAHNPGPVRPHIWLIAEGGYGYLGSSRLALKPEVEGGAPERTEVLDLGSLSLAGPYLRISAAVSF